MLSIDDITRFTANSIYGMSQFHDRWNFWVSLPAEDEDKLIKVIAGSKYVDQNGVSTTYTPGRIDASFEVTSPGFSAEIKQYIIRHGWRYNIDYIPGPLIADQQTSPIFLKTYYIKEEDIKMPKVKTQTPTWYSSFRKFTKVIRSGPVTVAWINGDKVMVRKTKKDKDDLEKAMLMLYAKSQFSSEAAFHRWFRDQMKIFKEAENNAKN